MNTQHQTEDNRLAELTAYAETYDDLDSALREAISTICEALEAVEAAHALCEEARDEAAERNDDDAYSELDDLCALIDSTHSELEYVSIPDTFQRRAAPLRNTLEQERAACSATVNQE